MRQSKESTLNHIYVHNWKTFREVWKSTEFVSKFKDHTIQESKPILIDYFKQLLTDTQSLCSLFPDSLKKDHVQLIKEVLKMSDFQKQLAYQHEALYFGKKKQMLVYRCNHRSLCSYLSKYRLPSKYIQLFDGLNKDYQELKKKMMDRNLKISRREPRQAIGKIQEEIKESEKFKFGKSFSIYLKYLETIFKDFDSQPTKQEILLEKINTRTRKQIEVLCQKYQFKVSDRYYEDQAYLDVKDILIHKKTWSDDEESFESSFDSQSDTEKMELNEKKNSIMRPKNITSVQIIELKKHGVECQVELKSSGIKNTPQYLRCRLKYPCLTQFQKQYSKLYPLTEEQIQHTSVKITLDPISHGYTEYVLTTGNEAGQSADAIVKVWIQAPDQSTADIKEIKHQNNQLYIIGESQEGLILDKDKGSIKTTEGKWKKMIVGCTDFSISNHVILCNDIGDCAGWGRMYFYGEQDQQEQDNKKQEQPTQNQFNFIKPYNFRLEQLCQVMSDNKIRKISCGDSYCLMVNYLGQVWGFGLNNFGQLGLGHADESVDTSQPVMINKLSETFIVDVKATNYGSSFAIDYKGQVYRWGLNQMESSPKPVYDTYSNIINFEYSNIILSQHVPIMISKKMISDPIKQVCSGKDFSFALTDKNQLYGWGNTQYLGLDQVINPHFQEIKNICNPIKIMNNVIQIRAGESHCVALKQNGDLIGWGYACNYGGQKKYVKTPQVILKQYKGTFVDCGSNFVVYEIEPGYIAVRGSIDLCKKAQKYEIPCKARKLEAGNGVIMVMGNTA